MASNKNDEINKPTIGFDKNVVLKFLKGSEKKGRLKAWEKTLKPSASRESGKVLLEFYLKCRMTKWYFGGFLRNNMYGTWGIYFMHKGGVMNRPQIFQSHILEGLVDNKEYVSSLVKE